MYGKRNVSGQSGFTLFELLLVLCIISILCGIAIARLNIKDTTSSAWDTVRESAYKAAKSALTKALAQDPENPPTLDELAHDIDTKRKIFVADCAIAGPIPNLTPGGECLALDINNDGHVNVGEVFARPYTNDQCTLAVTDHTSDDVCCIERPFFDTSATAPVLPTVFNVGDPIP